MNARINSKDWLLLSAYVDGQLTPGERAKLEKQLNERQDLQEELRSLKRMRALLRRLPPKPVPHNFTLTTLMARQAQRRSWWLPVLSFSSLTATLLLVASFLIKLPSAAMPAMMAPIPMAAAEADRAYESAVEAEQPPIIILWGRPEALYSFNGMGGGDGLPIGGAPQPALDASREAVPLTEPELEMVPPPAEKEADSPQEPVEMIPDEEPPPEIAMPAATATALPPEEPLSGSGPILGVRPASERGEMTLRQPLPIMVVEAEEMPANRLSLLQVALAAFALISGLTAFMLWKKSRP